MFGEFVVPILLGILTFIYFSLRAGIHKNTKDALFATLGVCEIIGVFIVKVWINAASDSAVQLVALVSFLLLGTPITLLFLEITDFRQISFVLNFPMPVRLVIFILPLIPLPAIIYTFFAGVYVVEAITTGALVYIVSIFLGHFIFEISMLHIARPLFCYLSSNS